MSASPTNVLGTPLQCCCTDPMTGFFRDGYCRTAASDRGMHTVCIIATDEFLEFSRAQGNDLSTPMPQYGFAGLKAGDQWCLCASRWQEAHDAGMAPQVKLRSTHVAASEFCDIEALKRHAIDL